MTERKSNPPRPVSESAIWDQLMDFYDREGPEAWRSGRIPQRITSNAYTADLYASVASAFLRDCSRGGRREVPLILEVGGGNGLFAWLFLNRLLRHHLPDEDVPAFEYFLTDAAASNVRAWMEVPRLRRLVDEGPLEMGLLRIAEEARVEAPGTRRLEPSEIHRRPCLVIANYVLDSLPSELMRVRNGRILREFLSLEQGGAPGDTPGEGFEPRFESHHVSPPYSTHGGVNEIIEGYRELAGEACIPVPLTAVSFLEPFLKGDAPFLMLAGDLAYTTTDFEPEPPMVFGDYIACTVNFHLLGALFQQRRGLAVFADQPDPNFAVGAFLKPGEAMDMSLTREALRHRLRHFTPHDALRIETALEVGGGMVDFRTVCAWLRFARFDPASTEVCIPHLIRLLDDGEPMDRVILHRSLLEAFRLVLPGVSREEGALDVRIAYLFVKAKMYPETLDFLEGSMAELGRSPERLYLLALAAGRLGYQEKAADHLRGVLELQPDYWDALAGPGRDPSDLVPWLLAEDDDDVHLNHIVLRLAVAEFSRLDVTEP